MDANLPYLFAKRNGIALVGEATGGTEVTVDREYSSPAFRGRGGARREAVGGEGL
jgi:hypothetical protein